jgi:hypothetical protein
MFRLRRIYRFTAAFAFALATAAAQTTAATWNSVQALPAGSEVRVAAGGRALRGKIEAVTDDSITLTSGKGQEMFTQQEVSRVSVKKPGHRRRNTLIGLGIGAGAGLGIGLAASSCTGLGCIGSRAVEIGAPLALGGVGTAIGALIPTGGWREVYRKY